jgi:hypothetical protein
VSARSFERFVNGLVDLNLNPASKIEKSSNGAVCGSNVVQKT